MQKTSSPASRRRSRSVAQSSAGISCIAALAFSGVADAGQLTAGVNLSGLEVNPGALPGVLGVNYVIPGAGALAYYKAKGLRLVRLPILWERLQPGLIGAQSPVPLDENYLACITGFLAMANAAGVRVIVDLHDYGGYGGHKLGDGTLRASALGTLWAALAARLASTPGLAGYDIMNEPSNMPNAKIWPQVAQQAVTAIRGADAGSTLYVEGDDWSSAGTWPQNNGSLDIADPEHKLVYEAHVYGDQDNSGTHFIWSEVVSQGVTINTIAKRVVPFGKWCRQRKAACIIGEVGVGNDDPHWNIELAKGLSMMRAEGISAFTYWAGGPWWGSYPMSIEPVGGRDAAQMDVVGRY